MRTEPDRLESFATTCSAVSWVCVLDPSAAPPPPCCLNVLQIMPAAQRAGVAWHNYAPSARLMETLAALLPLLVPSA